MPQYFQFQTELFYINFIELNVINEPAHEIMVLIA